MKKILLFIAMLPLLACAQIGQIQTEETPYELIGTIVLREKATNLYYLYVHSDNQYENKVVEYKIGENSTEAAKSISNLYATFQNVGKQFDLGGKTYFVWTDWCLRIMKDDDLYYTAGDYNITKWDMKRSVKKLVAEYGAIPDGINPYLLENK